MLGAAIRRRASGGGTPPSVFSAIFDDGVRSTGQTTYSADFTITSNSSVLFVVNKARVTASGTDSLTVGGVSATELSVDSYNDTTNKVIVYYFENCPTGTVTVEASGTTQAYSISITALINDGTQVPTVTGTEFTADFSSTGTITVLTKAVGADTVLYCISPSSNDVDEENSSITNALLQPVRQGLTGNRTHNQIHSASQIQSSSFTCNLVYEITSTATDRYGIYLEISY
jgi:hypothetical protein